MTQYQTNCKEEYQGSILFYSPSQQPDKHVRRDTCPALPVQQGKIATEQHMLLPMQMQARTSVADKMKIKPAMISFMEN